MTPQLSCAIACIVGSRSANSAVPPPFSAGAAARPTGPVAALMTAQATASHGGLSGTKRRPHGTTCEPEEEQNPLVANGGGPR